jgi:hypothetical protein
LVKSLCSTKNSRPRHQARERRSRQLRQDVLRSQGFGDFTATAQHHGQGHLRFLAQSPGFLGMGYQKSGKGWVFSGWFEKNPGDFCTRDVINILSTACEL